MHLFKHWYKNGENLPYQKRTYCGEIISSFARTKHPPPTGPDEVHYGCNCEACEEEYILELLGSLP